jgi:hypothetical protein
MSPKKDGLREATRNALKVMKNAGFEISPTVKVTVDPDLPFMGYSARRGKKSIIVVSGGALKSRGLEGLLIHEMSHIYRTDANHPSHNHDLLDRVARIVIPKNHLAKDYQIRVLREAINHLQDLYADDISFRVFSKTLIYSPEQASGFFQDWIEDKPRKTRSTRDVWLNISLLLNNCFALSNMKRHNVPDVDGKVQKGTERFLTQVGQRMRREYDYFRDLMINLKEEVSEEEFERKLEEYLNRIARLAEQEDSTVLSL